MIISLSQALPIERSSRLSSAKKLSPSRRTSITGQSWLVLTAATHSPPTRPTVMFPPSSRMACCWGRPWLSRSAPLQGWHGLHKTSACASPAMATPDPATCGAPKQPADVSATDAAVAAGSPGPGGSALLRTAGAAATTPLALLAVHVLHMGAAHGHAHHPQP